MNPNSKHYLSFDTGFPNAYDRAQGATGSALMVHGTCSSAGCYAMTDTGMSEIYALMREAFRGGQKAVELQAYPFRMTAENLVRHRLDPNIAFWRQLKEGSDRFEATREELVVGVSAGRYSFRPAKSPEREAEVLAYRAMEDDHMAVLLEEGRAAIRTTYADGGQHPSFTALWRRGVSLGEVSRPEALAYAGLEHVITPARATRLACLGTGTCAPSANEVKTISPPAAGEQLLAIAPLDGPSMWLKELPSLFTSAPVGGATDECHTRPADDLRSTANRAYPLGNAALTTVGVMGSLLFRGRSKATILGPDASKRDLFRSVLPPTEPARSKQWRALKAANGPLDTAAHQPGSQRPAYSVAGSDSKDGPLERAGFSPRVRVAVAPRRCQP